MVPSIHLVHRDPTIYPEPDRFRPERFLETPPGTYTWIPFGGGVRRCLGAAFAQQEMAIVLRELVARRMVRPADPAPERPFRRAITETPRHNAEVVLSSRMGSLSVDAAEVITTGRRPSPRRCATRRRSSIRAMPTTRSWRCTRSTRTTTGR